MHKPNKLKIYYILISVCFFILLAILISNIGNSGIGNAISGVDLDNDANINPGIIYVGFLLIIIAGGLLLLILNNFNPHMDHELISFNVDKPQNEKHLHEYLKFCKDKGRSYEDIKNILVKKGWDSKLLRETADKLNKA